MLSLFAAVAAYLVGSFPTAYVIGKYFRGIDITKTGTGNIGAMNAFDVTRSITVGISVAAIDIIKGLLVTFLSARTLGIVNAMIAGLFVVIGHNYSVFMKFKGGRGLATAAGVFLILAPLAVGIFLAVYFGLRLIGLKLYVSSVAGILSAAVAIFWNFSQSLNAEIILGLLLIVVLSKHMLPLRNELRNAHQE